MGSDHTRGRRLAVRCCQGACFGVGFLSTAFVVTVMFWILWCYLGLSVVQVSDTQRRGSPVFSYVPTTRRPANQTEVPVVESSVNAIYKTATTILTSSDRVATKVPALEPPKNATQAKGDFADRSRGDTTNPTPDAARGSKPKDKPEVKLNSETVYEGFDDGIHPRRVPPTAKENHYVGDGSEKEKLHRVDISPSQVEADNRPKSNYPDLNEKKPSSRDYPSSNPLRGDEIQSSRRSDTDYRDPVFERDYPRSSSRRYDDDQDSRRYRDRYDSRDRDRGRDTEDKLSKGDTRVYPERDSNPDRRPVDDERRRGDYPRSSSRRNDDDYDSRSYRDRYDTIDRERGRDTEDKFSRDDTRRVYSDDERDTYSDRRPVGDERYDQRRRGDDDRSRSPDDDRYRYRDDSYGYDYPRDESRRSEERSRDRDGIRRRDEDEYRRSETRYIDRPRPASRDGDRSEDYPPRDRIPVKQDEDSIRDTYDRDSPPVNSRSSASVPRKDRYEEDDNYRRTPSRSDERDRIVPTRVISESSGTRDRTYARYPDERDRQDNDRKEDRTRFSDDRREDRTRLSDDRKEDRTRLSDDRDRPRISDDRDYRPRISDDRDYRPIISDDRDRPRISDDKRLYRSRLPDDTEYRTRLPDGRIENRDDVVLETRSYPSRGRDEQDSRTRVRSDVDDRDLRRRSDHEYDRRSDEEHRNSKPRGDYESSRPRFEDDERSFPRRYDDREPVGPRKEPSSRDSYPADDRDRRNPSDYIDERYRPEYTDDRNRRNRPDDIDRRYPSGDIDDRDRSIRPYDRGDRPYQEDDRRPPSRYPDDRRQSPRRETLTGSSKPTEDVALREKRPQNADGRIVDLDRPLRPQDVIEAAQRQPHTSDLNNREVSSPVFNPKRSNLTSPEIIRNIDKKGITLTSRRKRRALRGIFRGE